jgi:hypothetical protein
MAQITDTPQRAGAHDAPFQEPSPAQVAYEAEREVIRNAKPRLVPVVTFTISKTGLVARTEHDGKTLDFPVVCGAGSKQGSDAYVSCGAVVLDMTTGAMHDARSLPGFVGIFPEKSAAK